MFQKVLRGRVNLAIQGNRRSLIFLGNSGSLKNFFVFNNQNSLLVSLWRDFQKKRKISEVQNSDHSLRLRARLYGLFKGKTFDFLNKQNSAQEKSLKEVQKLQQIDLSENDKATLEFLSGSLRKKLPPKKKRKISMKLNNETQFANFMFEVQNAQTVVDLLSEEQKGGILVCEFDFINSKRQSQSESSVGQLR